MTRMLAGVRLLAAVPVVCAVYALVLEAIGKIPPSRGAVLSPGALTTLRVLFPVSAIATVLLGIAWISPVAGHYVIRPVMRAVENRSRQALRDHPSLWSKLAKTAFPAIPAILVAIVAMIALVFALRFGVTEWLRIAKPSDAVRMMP